MPRWAEGRKKLSDRILMRKELPANCGGEVAVDRKSKLPTVPAAIALRVSSQPQSEARKHEYTWDGSGKEAASKGKRICIHVVAGADSIHAARVQM
jgi:hypothetical protein